MSALPEVHLIAGTRPEAIKLAPVAARMREDGRMQGATPGHPGHGRGGRLPRGQGCLHQRLLRRTGLLRTLELQPLLTPGRHLREFLPGLLAQALEVLRHLGRHTTGRFTSGCNSSAALNAGLSSAHWPNSASSRPS